MRLLAWFEQRYVRPFNDWLLSKVSDEFARDAAQLTERWGRPDATARIREIRQRKEHG